MWQKAKIINMDKRDNDIPIGSLVYVRDKPIIRGFQDRFGTYGEVRAFELNIQHPPSSTGYDGPAYMRSEFLELLPEFADDVPLIPWNEFLASIT